MASFWLRFRCAAGLKPLLLLGLIHRPEGRCFCRASLAQGERFVRRYLIYPMSLRDMGHPAPGTRRLRVRERPVVVMMPEVMGWS